MTVQEAILNMNNHIDIDEEFRLALGEDCEWLFDNAKFAERKVEQINKQFIEGKDIVYLALLSGVPPYEVEVRTGAGHNYYMVLDAIHRCYERNPDGRYDEGFKAGLRGLIQVSTSKVASLDLLLNYIFYQLDKEKDGTAKFTIEINEFIPLINDLIKDNREKYVKDYKMFGAWLEKVQKYALEKYGLEFV